MSIKRIEMDWMCGTNYSIFCTACELALKNQCDDVVFEFNGGKFSVSRHSKWGEITEKALQEFPKKEGEVAL